MFWNKKKNSSDESEQDLYDIPEEELEDEETDEKIEENDDTADSEENEENDDFDPEEYFGGEDEEGAESESDNTETDTSVTVTVSVSSLNSLVEFISLRHPVDLQFMKKENNEVFELRESHFRLAKVWGSVSMYRECSAEEYAKIALATELLESPDDFYVLPALTEKDLKAAMIDFCEEKYGAKSKKYAANVKKFTSFVESNGDKEEWKLFLKEVIYKKTEDFCLENNITFVEEDEEDADE